MRSFRWFAVASLVTVLVAGAAGAEDQIPWQPTVEAAQEIAARTNRLVLLHFWTTTCAPCSRLENEVFTRPEVARELDRKFVMVKLNAEQAEGTARLYGVSSVPTDVITLPNGQLVSQVHCPPSPQQYVAQLNQVVAGHHALLARSSATSTTPGAAAPPAAAIVQQSAPRSSAAGNTAAPAAAIPRGAVAPPATHPNDRYADYFPGYAAGTHPGAVAGASAGSPAAAQQAAAAHPATRPAPQFGPSGAPSMSANSQPGAVPTVQAGAAVAASYAPQANRAVQLPPGSPPLGLEGYCPVTLVDQQQWTMGDARYGAIHRGRTYLFLGPNEVKKFMAAPDRFAPVLGGNDPVKAVDLQQLVPGRREFGVYSDNRVYLFADAESRRQFEQNPQRYAPEALQASANQPVTR